MMARVLNVGFLIAFCNTVATAAPFGKTELQLGLDVLNYSSASSEADLDDLDVKTDAADFVAFEPNLTLTGFLDSWAFSIRSDARGRTSSGSGMLAYLVKPNWYVGGILRYHSLNVKTEVAADGVGNDKDSKNELHSREIGPLVMYREKSAERTLTGLAKLTQVLSEGKGEVEDAEVEINFKTLAFGIGGSYHYRLSPRLHIGAGLSYTMSLGGDAEIEAEAGSASKDQDGDFEMSSFELTLAELLVDL